jgi:hypothetical protein
MPHIQLELFLRTFVARGGGATPCGFCAHGPKSQGAMCLFNGTVVTTPTWIVHPRFWPPRVGWKAHWCNPPRDMLACH